MKLSEGEMDSIRRIAELQMRQEAYAVALEAEKERLRRHVPLWHRIFPFTITRRKV